MNLVRGDIKPAQRITLGSLIVSYVHGNNIIIFPNYSLQKMLFPLKGRDVVKELIAKKVTSLNDFAWVAQLQYLWVNELVQVQMIMTSINYGYEYLGNTSRLVMTPLTDRCFRYL